METKCGMDGHTDIDKTKCPLITSGRRHKHGNTYFCIFW